MRLNGLCGQVYTGPAAAQAAQGRGILLERSGTRRPSWASFCCPAAHVVALSFAWAAWFLRLVRDYERLEATLKGLHLLAFACLMLRNLAKPLA